MVPIIQLFQQLSLIFSMKIYELYFVVLHFISIRQLEILTVFIAFIDQVFPVSMLLHTWTASAHYSGLITLTYCSRIVLTTLIPIKTLSFFASLPFRYVCLNECVGMRINK